MAVSIGLGVLTLVTAIARRIAGPYGSHRLAAEALRNRLGVGEAGSPRALEELRDEVDQLRAEVADLRSRAGEMDDVQNRLDFAERMLAQVREKNALPGGR
jgi:hypothetical protein